MLGTAPVETGTKTLQVGVGFATHPDAIWAAVRATAMARTGLQGAAAEMVLLITAGVPSQDTMPMIRSVLGPVGIAGGATAAILTHNGAVGSGALVVCLANSEGAVSGVAASAGRDLVDAAQGAARLILAGWPFRMRYPRGLGLAFCRPGIGAPAESFLASWRLLMGPKMRTVCSVLSTPVVYGASQAEPIVSAACLEAPYSTGLGYADGFEADSMPDRRALIQGSVEATRAAVKRLEGDAARLVLVVESDARHRALGSAAGDEWAAIKNEVDARVPCVGWLCQSVAAYGRGVRPTDAHGSLVIVALGDAPRRGAVATAPRQRPPHERSRRHELLRLRVRRCHAVDQPHAARSGATAEEARRGVCRPVAKDRARVGPERPRAERDRLAQSAPILARAARVRSQALPLDDERSEALDDLDGRAEDT